MLEARPDVTAAVGLTATVLPSTAGVDRPEGAPSETKSPFGSGAAAPLALKEGIDTPPRFEDPKGGRCQRVPDWLKLLNSATGECIDPRCRATNRCEFCRKLAAAETVEMLLLDAMDNAPPYMATLTARVFPAGDELRRTLAKIVKACRLRFPEFEWFVPRERQARGELHVHPLIKGVPLDEASMKLLYETITRVWCGRHDAIAYPFERRQEGPQGLKRTRDGQGLVRYLTADLSHSLKSSQALELGYRGHRTSQTRGYFPDGAAAARAAARESLRRRRLAWKLAAAGHTAEEVAHQLDTPAEGEWRIHRVAVPRDAARAPADGRHGVPTPLLEAACRWLVEHQPLEAGRGHPPSGISSPLRGP